ncbi:MAG: aspartyl-phosphate phosphatase Spo0E family protein [Actinomycetia bacterium]|nr:aspartyl-phosphate phosphatase Spo0E family protein [Actinomycetes bacterium]
MTGSDRARLRARIECLRQQLSALVAERGTLGDPDVLALSAHLDGLVVRYLKATYAVDAVAAPYARSVGDTSA